MKRKMNTGLRCGLAMLAYAGVAAADVSMPAIFGDHMVLQARQPIVVWGLADPGESITVELGSDKAAVKAGADGGWKVSLPERAPGTDLVLKVTGANTLEYKDVAVGEVWVCSGQSNMAMLLKDCVNGRQDIREASLPMIRMFTVQRELNLQPQVDFKGAWKVCSPDTALNFSAVAFYFGRDLNRELNVPVGLINTSWGGTRIEPWTASGSLDLIPGFKEQADSLASLQASSEERLAAFHEAQAKRDASVATIAGMETNEDLHRQMASADLDDANWPEMEIPGEWEKAGLPDFDGLVWFRKQIEIPAGWEGRDLVLNLGPVDEMDSTWFNQTRIGGKGDFTRNITTFWNVPRTYRIPGTAVRAGRNILMVRVIDSGYAGGIWGAAPADLHLAPADQDAERIPVAGRWRYQAGQQLFPVASIPFSRETPTVLYNAMIHPIISFGIRGAIWYQGESNVTDGPLYTHKKRALVHSWRHAWGQGDFPFLFVQLAPFDYRHDDPFVLPELWNAQRESLAIPNTGMAVITDLGSLRDIHPRQKHEVGARLARWALAKTYGRDALAYSGPLVKSAVREGSAVRVSFDHVGGGLVAREELSLAWFELAGADGVFVRANAKIQENDVIVSARTVTEPSQVRFGWAEEGEVELRNKDGLPASPFRINVE